MTEVWLDCSQPLGRDTPVPPGQAGVDLQAVRTYAANGMSMQRLCVLTHQGTHVDAPSHFFAGAATIDEVALASLSGPVHVVELMRESLSSIGASDLAAVPRDHLVFIKTGWSMYYSQPRYWESPFLDESAALRLVELGVRALGVDLISPDEPAHPGRAAGFSYPVHRRLLGAGVPIIENLNLAHVPPGDYDGVAFPIRVEGADGAPCRVALRRRS